MASVPPSFIFTCKAPQQLTLTHLRHSPQTANPHFLSSDLLRQFVEAIQTLLPQTGALMLQFEYLNRRKMPSFNLFLQRLEQFFEEKPPGIPLAVEIRNKNYANRAYFSLLQKYGIIPVLSEKQFMPSVTELISRYSRYFTDTVVIRLLGGSRGDIEQITRNRWDRIVQPQQNLPQIAASIQTLLARQRKVIVNVNNHYEGCAPLSIKRLQKLLQQDHGAAGRDK
ncbi:MAG TPA: DUF72 domain-containing protein [Calditrichaeota bacterium]|nr:DUF72 domain-containing protein [Calditrichota bacterium]